MEPTLDLHATMGERGPGTPRSFSADDIDAALAEAKRLISAHIADSERTLRYTENSERRIVHSIRHVLRFDEQIANPCEIGFGPVGLTYHLLTGKPITGFDLVDTYLPLCRKLNIPLQELNLRTAGQLPTSEFDLVMLFEVIEHIDRPPAALLEEIRGCLASGGHLVMSTVNLTRLLNRVRLVLGRPLFADYDWSQLVMAHFREYTREELHRYLISAGFCEVNSAYYCQMDFRRGNLFAYGYRAACVVLPTLSNVIFLDAKASHI